MGLGDRGRKLVQLVCNKVEIESSNDDTSSLRDPVGYVVNKNQKRDTNSKTDDTVQSSSIFSRSNASSDLDESQMEIATKMKEIVNLDNLAEDQVGLKSVTPSMSDLVHSPINKNYNSDTQRNTDDIVTQSPSIIVSRSNASSDLDESQMEIATKMKEIVNLDSLAEDQVGLKSVKPSMSGLVDSPININQNSDIQMNTDDIVIQSSSFVVSRPNASSGLNESQMDHQVASTSKKANTNLDSPGDEIHLFGSDYSDQDPTYEPSSEDDNSTSSRHIGFPGNEVDDLTDDEVPVAIAAAPSEIIMGIINNLLDKVWISVKPLKRRKKAEPKEWKRNIQKARKAEGLTYETRGIVRPAKVPKPVNCSKCIYKCTENFTSAERDSLCRHFYGIDYKTRKNFIISCITIHPVKTRKLQKTSNKKDRLFSKKCFFQKDGAKIQVCQKFFMATLNISADVIYDALNKVNPLGLYDSCDKRGMKAPPNKTKQDDVNFVKEHIESFPVMESHYCRKNSKKQYLAPDVYSILNMYRLYSELCTSVNRKPVSENKYREIFTKDYNISFFNPKKDLCVLCTKYKKAESKDEIELEYQEHIQRKITCQAAKDADKIRANTDDKFMSLTMDLQAVLQVPSGRESILYYMRKLVVYNFTIYEARRPNNAYCLCWSELNGKKGSSEIGTCLLYYLSHEMPKTVTEVSIFSDTCSGQNRNQYISSLLLWAVHKVDNLQVIEQKFLESGHTHMEVDSMHAAIENAAKKVMSINSVSDWKNIFKQARNKKRKAFKNEEGEREAIDVDNYNVKEFKYSEMLDLKNLGAIVMKNKNKDNMKEAVNWLKIKRMRYVRGDLKIYFNYDMSEDFRELDVFNTNQNTSRATRRSNPPSVAVPLPDSLELLYENQLPISAAKKKDLQTLCKKEIIPEELHAWINNMKTLTSNDTNDTDDE